jgi:hypothetical protein
MAITAFPGTVVVFGQANSRGGANPTDYNTTVAPSGFQQGSMLLDPRPAYSYQPDQNYGGFATNSSLAVPVLGWCGEGELVVMDQVPTTISTNSVAQAQSFTSSTPLTLTASNSNNVTVGVSIYAPELGTYITTNAIDGAAGWVTFGSDTSIASWDPTKSLSRTLTISTTGTDTGGFWSVAGRDIYGVKISELVAASTTGAAATLATKKAYKYITAITPVTTGTFGSTVVYVGVGDTYGIPLYVSNGAYTNIWSNNTLTASSTNVIAGQSLSSTATSTTPDVRGTYTSSTASNGTNRIVMFVTPSVAALNAASSAGIAGHGVVGVIQYSSI